MSGDASGDDNDASVQVGMACVVVSESYIEDGLGSTEEHEETLDEHGVATMLLAEFFCSAATRFAASQT